MGGERKEEIHEIGCADGVGRTVLNGMVRVSLIPKGEISTHLKS